MTHRMVIGHRVRNRDDRCEACGRSVNDVMSGFEFVKVGDEGVACTGRVNQSEIDQGAVERERRRAAFDAVVGVSSR